MMTIDLNCDMGEGIGNDALIMPWISSASIACGFHAGDNDTMKRTIALALEHNVAIGAHPSFNDRKNFGRTEMHLNDEELYELITEQLHRISSIADECGGRLHHVKPHGALYNMAAINADMSHVIAKAVRDVDASLVLYGLSNSQLIHEAEKLGLKTANEVFADRTYRDDATLTPRTEPNALLETEDASLQHVLKMVLEKAVTATSGKIIPIKTQTICIHGDGAHAATFAKSIHQALKRNGIDIKTV